MFYSTFSFKYQTFRSDISVIYNRIDRHCYICFRSDDFSSQLIDRPFLEHEIHLSRSDYHRFKIAYQRCISRPSHGNISETLAEIVVLFQFSFLKAGFICHAGIDYGGFPFHENLNSFIISVNVCVGYSAVGNSYSAVTVVCTAAFDIQSPQNRTVSYGDVTILHLFADGNLIGINRIF